MTSGTLSGTKGDTDLWRRLNHPQFGPLLIVALVGTVLATVNVSSELIEHAASGQSLALWKPVSWEGSSLAIILAMAPLVGAAIRHWPPSREGLARFVFIHGALTVPFSLTHVVVVYLVRNAVYWMMHERYGFFDYGVASRLLYEWRKDVLIYAGIGLIYALLRPRQAPDAVTPTAHTRIEVRHGGLTQFLNSSEVLFVEAAGNYVEFHTAERTYLVRGTLRAWETRLEGAGFVRVHRARLVNRAYIRAVKSTPSGDIDITLHGTHTLVGSRRYRAALR